MEIIAPSQRTLFRCVLPHLRSTFMASNYRFASGFQLLITILIHPSAGRAVISTFSGNSIAPLALREESFETVVRPSSTDWVVFFCVEWYEPCEELKNSFRMMGREFETQLNAASVLTPAVRFAEVDCAADKVLCNQQKVDFYPVVTHYIRGQRSKAWVGALDHSQASIEETKQQLRKWLKGRLGNEHQSEDLPIVQRGTILVVFPVAVILVVAWMLVVFYDISTRSASENVKPEVSERQTCISSTGRLARRLPKEWATERGSIEL